ncbi:MAG: YigZ family protein [Campylobacterota bacterium]|nr:YigZ family protein [Campylobacterota bacterium]
MKYVESVTTNILEIKQSKFMAFLMPYIKYKETLDSLKKAHPKARHFVVAYRYLNGFNQIVEHSSDDGEPKGTSGKPTLMVLQGAGLINSAIIIVRYFGGTKLGTGGLVRAYSDATNLLLSKTTLIEYKDELVKKISFNYSNSGKIEYKCNEYNIDIVKKFFDLDISYEIKGSIEDMEIFLQKIDRLILR